MYNAARSHYNAALRINPHSVTAHHNLGLLYAKHFQDKENAKHHYKKALELNPQNDQLHLNIAWLLSTQPAAPEDLIEAKKRYEVCLQINPHNHQARRSMAYLLSNAFQDYDGTRRIVGPDSAPDWSSTSQSKTYTKPSDLSINSGQWDPPTPSSTTPPRTGMATANVLSAPSRTVPSDPSPDPPAERTTCSVLDSLGFDTQSGERTTTPQRFIRDLHVPEDSSKFIEQCLARITLLEADRAKQRMETSNLRNRVACLEDQIRQLLVSKV